MKWRILIKKEELDSFVKKYGEQTFERVRRQLAKLKNGPFEIPYKKLKGEESLYRIRVGEFRIIFTYFPERKLILVLRIRKRKDAY